MRVFRRDGGGTVVRLKLDDELRGLVGYFMKSTGVNSIDEAVRALVRRGYDYWLLERKYGGDVDSMRVWDAGFKCMELEAGFLYYRMRVREVIEELKNAVLILSGVLADLEACYRECGAGGVDLDRISGYRAELSRYMDEYIKPLRDDVEEGKYVDEAEIVRHVEELVEKYKEKLGMTRGEKE
ncbi:MAG: hypothetical protein F7C38_05170 [Desulfurococcales archaeon]|nr:hypothetical protein [Desulfurococcales archaeon]